MSEENNNEISEPISMDSEGVFVNGEFIETQKTCKEFEGLGEICLGDTVIVSLSEKQENLTFVIDTIQQGMIFSKTDKGERIAIPLKYVVEVQKKD